MACPPDCPNKCDKSSENCCPPPPPPCGCRGCPPPPPHCDRFREWARVGMRAPEVQGMFVMADNSMTASKLSEFASGKYVCLFFYPLDFTFVCPSEILAFNEKVAEFNSRNCALVGCSIDSHFTHAAWKNTPVNSGGIGKIQFPLISDIKKCAAKSYGVLHPDGVALRGLFIMDKDFVIRHALVNDLPLGRSVDEALRVLDALQFHEEHGEVCPANWKKGQKAMKPSAEGVAEYLKETFAK